MNDDHDIERHAAAVHRRDAANLIRIVVAVVLVAALVIVGLDNREDVRVGYAIGHATAPIWMVIVAAGVAGVVLGWLMRHRAHRAR